MIQIYNNLYFLQILSFFLFIELILLIMHINTNFLKYSIIWFHSKLNFYAGHRDLTT